MCSADRNLACTSLRWSDTQHCPTVKSKSAPTATACFVPLSYSNAWQWNRAYKQPPLLPSVSNKRCVLWQYWRTRLKQPPILPSVSSKICILSMEKPVIHNHPNCPLCANKRYMCSKTIQKNLIFHLIYPLSTRVIGVPKMISQLVSSIFLCSPLPSGTWQTSDLWFPDVVFPLLLLSALSPSPFQCALHDGFGQNLEPVISSHR